MENDRGYFNIDHSIGGGRESYDTLFAMDPALLTPSAVIGADPNSHEDLDNILGGPFTDQVGSGSGMMNTGYAWNVEGTAYSPYPDISYTHGLSVDQQHGAGFASRLNANCFGQSFPDHASAGMQAIPEIGGHEVASTKTSDWNSTSTQSPSKRGLDAATGDVDGTQPKSKKKRGPRKTKVKSEDEIRAKEERKLERNRLAASKCRQKKKAATENQGKRAQELERENNWMKACLEEAKQDRNNILALLLEHKGCGHIVIDEYFESTLDRIATEFKSLHEAGEILGAQSQMNADAQQFLTLNANSPSDGTQYGQSQSMSRHNSNSIDSIAMSRSGSNESRCESVALAQISNFPIGPPATHASQSWAQQYAAGYRNWQQQFSQQQEQQRMSRQDSRISSSSHGSSMSRQGSSRTSVSVEHGEKTDSGISNVDTPPEERKKNIPASPYDEAISLAAQENTNAFQSKVPKMMPNQRILRNHPATHPITVGPSDLPDPSAFLSGLTGPVCSGGGA